MKHIFLFLALIASGISTSSAQTNFPCTDTELLADVKWLDFNVIAAGWPETSKLTLNVAGDMYFDHDKRTVWPNHFNSIIGASVVAANIWTVVQFGDQWYGATYEWIPNGRQLKQIGSYNGAHVNKLPFCDGDRAQLCPGFHFVPKNGEIYGFMLSDFARGGMQAFATFKERTNIAWYQWGVGMVDVCAVEPEPEPEPDPVVIAPITDLILGN